jgi:hypothetical protein
MVTIVVPPALPLALTVGTMFALVALRKHNIFCISPGRVNLAGKVNCWVFDKTGTLTTDGLELCELRPTRRPGAAAPRDEATPEGGNDGGGGGSGGGSDNRAGASAGGVGASSAAAANGDGAATGAGAAASAAACFAAPATQMRDLQPELAALLACCHSLTRVRGEVAGDPLEIETFAFAGAEMREMNAPAAAAPDGASAAGASPAAGDDEEGLISVITLPSPGVPPLQFRILRQFDFSPNLARMGVVARDGAGGLASFVKGSPEALRALCAPASLPPDFEAVLASYTRRGLRVLGCGVRRYRPGAEAEAAAAELLAPPPRGAGGALAPAEEQRAAAAAARSAAERGLDFLGFIVLENRLKSQSAPTIARLRDEAGLLMHMATGDNAVSAVAVARMCGLLEPTGRVFLCDTVEGGGGGGGSGGGGLGIEWRDVDGGAATLDPHSLLPVEATAALLQPPPSPSPFPYRLAMTGRAFGALQAAVGAGRLEARSLQRALVACGVFARMSPEDKGALVEALQAMGLYVGMVGDGANDTMALRAAHVGISLSQVEASVAAPFTYAVPDPSIDVIPRVLCEGRGALATSFCLFQFMALYSTIQFANALLIVFAGSFLSNNMRVGAAVGRNAIGVCRSHTCPSPPLSRAAAPFAPLAPQVPLPGPLRRAHPVADDREHGRERDADAQAPLGPPLLGGQPYHYFRLYCADLRGPAHGLRLCARAGVVWRRRAPAAHARGPGGHEQRDPGDKRRLPRGEPAVRRLRLHLRAGPALEAQPAHEPALLRVAHRVRPRGRAAAARALGRGLLRALAAAPAGGSQCRAARHCAGQLRLLLRRAVRSARRARARLGCGAREPLLPRRAQAASRAQAQLARARAGGRRGVCRRGHCAARGYCAEGSAALGRRPARSKVTAVHTQRVTLPLPPRPRATRRSAPRPRR